MSDFRAIRGASLSLRNLLQDRMQTPVPVTIAPPDVTVTNMTGQQRLNLYLYQVSENGYLSNQEIPGHGHPGAYGHPPLYLNLHYVLTAHGGSEVGPDSDLQAQQILGDAMRVLHDLPIVTDKLQTTRVPPGGNPQPILDTSLVGESEGIKIILQPATLEDFSKIWAALPDANFRRSVAYQVSVVRIESRRLRRFPKLVGEPPLAGPRVFVVPFRSPQITEMRVRRPGDPADMERPLAYARIGDTLIIRGRNFTGDNATRVMLGGVNATAQIRTPLQDDRIEVTIPDNTALQPGVQPARVVLDVMMGEPPRPHPGFQSNLAAFMLVPGPITLFPNTGTLPRTLRITGARLFRSDRESLTLIGDEVIRSGDYTTSTPTEISFNLPAGLGSGRYAVRVRVDGSESIDERTLVIP
jgi:hypothetical protein